MKSGLICYFLCLIIVVAATQQTSYEGYKVWNLVPENVNQLRVLKSWETISQVDIWEASSLVGFPWRVMVGPKQQLAFEEFLIKYEIKREIIIDDVERVFEQERQQQRIRPKNTFDFSRFWTVNEINDYITYLAAQHGDICSQSIVSTSSQGRLIRAVKISKKGGGHIDKSRPIAVIDAGIHAREWIAPMTAVYFLNQLLENSTAYGHILDKIDIIIIPSMNPDGYDFSQSDNRLWRKTRGRTSSSLCIGTDGNRNYGHMWQSSIFACSETYSGLSPFSEPESQALRNIIEEFVPNVKLYVSLHSYGNWFLYPWGFDNVLIENWEEHHAVGDKFAQAVLSATGTRYTVGNSAILLYPAFGASDDYAANAGVNLSYTLELPGGGRFGFDIPANRIIPVTQETWIGFQEVLNYVANKNW